MNSSLANDRFRTIRSLGCTFDNDKPGRGRLESLCACQQADHCVEREDQRKLLLSRMTELISFYQCRYLQRRKTDPMFFQPPILYLYFITLLSLFLFLSFSLSPPLSLSSFFLSLTSITEILLKMDVEEKVENKTENLDVNM